MTIYEGLQDEAYTEELTVKEKPLYGTDGRIRGRRIALRKDALQTEKACALSEELGHHHTTYGDILDQTDVMNRKQERKARLWAYNRMITLDRIMAAKKSGCRNRYEIAEHLEITEAFLQEAIDSYKSIYGLVYNRDGYLITFEPFNIYEVM